MMKIVAPLLVSLASLLSRPAAAAPCGTENLLAGKTPLRVSGVRGDPGLLTDGKIGSEGAQWNAPVVVTLDDASAAVMFDLAEPRGVSALFMQGDANDTYQVWGSLDLSASSFKVIATFPNVVDTGHGLRTRTVEIAPVTVRYLRLSGAKGDGYFSISEVGAHCAKPAPFPPPMDVAAAPPQFAASEEPKRGWQSFGVLYALAAAAFVVLLARGLKRA